MKVRYSTNWMGVANLNWYRDRNLLEKKTITVSEGSILAEGGKYKAGDTFEVEEPTQYYSCGRLDFWNPHNDSMFSDELGVPPMRNEDWSSFGDWLDTFEADDVLNLNQLVELYEQTNPKIQWAKE